VLFVRRKRTRRWAEATIDAVSPDWPTAACASD
jgi:hypothetical protein